MTMGNNASAAGNGPGGAVDSDLKFLARPQPGSFQAALLVVEDELDDFALLKRDLENSGMAYSIFWARSGAEAVSLISELAEKNLKICLVLDLQLPDMTG